MRRFDIWSVFKVSVIFYVVRLRRDAGRRHRPLERGRRLRGRSPTAEKLVRSLFALNTFILHPITALFWWGSVIAGAVCFLGVLFNVFAAVLYNLISDVVGGIQVDRRQRPGP